MLSPLAYWLHESTKDGTADENEIKRKLEEIRTADEDVDQLWISFRDHTPLFTEYAHGHYGFAHRTFQEYLVSKELLRPKNDPLDRIYQRRHQVHWEEPILLAMSSESNATNLIRTAILADTEEAKRRSFGQSRYNDVLHSDFLFAVRCVIDGAIIDDELINRFVAQLVEWWFSEVELDRSNERVLDWKFLDGLADAITYLFSSMRGTLLERRITEVFLGILNEANTPAFETELTERINAAELAGEPGYGSLAGMVPPKMYQAYRALKVIGQDCSPEVIKFFLRVWRTESRDVSSDAERILEGFQQRDGIIPILVDILKGEVEEIKLFSAILLAELGQTTPEGARCLFAAIAQDDFRTWSHPDRKKLREQNRRDRAYNSLMQIQKSARIEQAQQVIAVLNSIVADEQKQIQLMAESHTGKELHMFLGDTYPHDIRKLIAVYLLVRLGRADALNILQSEILKPESGQLFLRTIQRLVPFEFWDEATMRAVRLNSILGSSHGFSLTFEPYAAVFAAKRLSALQQVSDKIIMRVFELSAYDDTYIQEFAIALFNALQCRRPFVYSRLMALLVNADNPQEDHYNRDRVRECAAEALHGIGDIPSEYLTRLLELIRKPPLQKIDRRIRWWCLKILEDRRITTPVSTHREIAETLLSIFQSEESETNAEAIEHLLGYFAVSPEVMPLLIDALTSDDQRTRTVGWFALGHDFGRGRKIDAPPGAQPSRLWNNRIAIPVTTILVLLKVLTDSDDQVSQRAVYMLEQSAEKPSELIDGLRALMGHSNPWVRCRAIKVLVALDYNERDMVPVWFELIGNENASVRSEAIQLRGKLLLTPKEEVIADDLAISVHASEYIVTPGVAALLKAARDETSILNLILKVKYNTLAFMEMDSANQSTLFQIISDPDILSNELGTLALGLSNEEKSEIFDAEELETQLEEFRERAIWKIGEEANLENETISLLVPLLDDLSNGIQASAIGALAEIFARFPVGFQSERREFADRLYEIIKQEERGIGDAWPALWKVAQTL